MPGSWQDYLGRAYHQRAICSSACRQNIEQREDATILVFDFGGGTLDVSLVECFDNVVQIEAVSGDNHLGGSDFDSVNRKIFLRETESVVGFTG